MRDKELRKAIEAARAGLVSSMDGFESGWRAQLTALLAEQLKRAQLPPLEGFMRSAAPDDPYGPHVTRQPSHLGADDYEAAAREGVDLNKELGAYDPRASTPRCTHGLLFSEPCEKCQATADLNNPPPAIIV